MAPSVNGKVDPPEDDDFRFSMIDIRPDGSCAIATYFVDRASFFFTKAALGEPDVDSFLSAAEMGAVPTQGIHLHKADGDEDDSR